MIVQYPATVLRIRAEPALTDDPERYVELFRDMQEAMMENKGVGIAAPQIGVSVAAILIAPTKDHDMPLYLLNPRITKTSGIKFKHNEGCLSCKKTYTVRRHTSVQVTATNAMNPLEDFNIRATGFESCIFQHEVDHLNGITIVERAGMR